MRNFSQLTRAVQQLAQTEKRLTRQLDELEDAAVAAEQGSAPELTRILLLHADILRAILEQSRRRWIRLSAVLGTSLIACLGLLLLTLLH